MVSIKKNRQYNLTAKIVVTNEDTVSVAPRPWMEMFKIIIADPNLYNVFFSFRHIWYTGEKEIFSLAIVGILTADVYTENML
jgi:hypothetical protein